MKEIWKPINDNILYEVSNFGNIRHVVKKIKRKFRLSNNGYSRLNLSVPNEKYKLKGYMVHRLVAIHFLKNEKNLNIVNHIDGNKTNNHVDNLEWCTQKKNAVHAVETNLKRYEHQLGARKLKDEEVLEIREILSNKPLKRKVNSEFNLGLIADRYNICAETVRSIWNGNSYLYLEKSFEGSETIPIGSTLKRVEAVDILIQDDDIVPTLCESTSCN